MPCLIFRAGVVGAFHGVDVVEALVHADVETDIVEDEEFGFRTEIGGVADARGIHIVLGGLGDGARAAAIALAGGRLETSQIRIERGLGEEGIDHCGVEIGHQRHVGFVDRLPAGDGRAVEHRAVGQEIFVDHRQVERDVLPLSARVGEAQIDDI